MTKRTPLYDFHVNNGGKVVEFAGWDLPVRFNGIIEEHNATRNSATLFDVSHMGEIFVDGPEAEAALNYLCCNDITKIADNQAQYSALLNELGGVIDDIIIYRFNTEKYLICVNASNADKDYAWLTKRNKFNCKITNHSEKFGQIAIQGPLSESILSELVPAVKNLKYFYFAEAKIADVPVIVARTGYTGEDGFEIFIPTESTAKITDIVYQHGKDKGLTLAGLGARDSLRLEASYPLHGHELGEHIPALASGLGWIIKMNKPDFIGKSNIEKYKAGGNIQKLCGFKVTGQGIVRENTKVFDSNKNEIGFVTSGTKTPTVNTAIGMMIIPETQSTLGNKLQAEVRGNLIEIEVIKLPFYKRA